MESWKPIEGYEGRYEVSDLGNIRSVPHLVLARGGSYRLSPARVLATSKSCARPHVCLEGKYHSVHRLVAMAFCDGYFEGAVVNHKDEDKRNNRADNLEWCTQSYNCKYGHRNDNMIERTRTPVSQYSLGGIFIKTYPSLHEASRQTGISNARICNVCKGKRRQAGGFKWAYANK